MYAGAFLSLALLLAIQLTPVRGNTSPGIKQKLKAIAVKKVKSKCPSCKVSVQCKWISPAVLKKAPAAVKDLFFVEAGLPAGYETARVIFKNDKPGNDNVQFYIYVQRKLPVAQRMIKRGEVVNKEDIVWKWIDVSQFTKEPVHSVKYFRGKAATHIIRKGQVFYPSDLAGAAAVQPGDHVIMLYVKGGIQIQVDCIAREAKKTGQKIRLFSKETRRLYLAKIINKNKIVWVKTL